MTPDEKREVDRIEKGRREREALLAAMVLLLADDARRLSGAAVRSGNDPIDPIRKVMLGDPQLHLPGLPDALATAMADAFAQGFSEAFNLAKVPMPAEEAAPAVDESFPIYRAGIVNYQTIASATAQTIFEGLGRIVQQAIADARADGKRTRDIARAVLKSFTRFGWTRFEPGTVNPDSKGSAGFAAVGAATDAILSGWGAGFWNGLRHPAVDVKLAGLRHVSVIDNGTTPICLARGMPSVQYRKDDPYWLDNVPPLHRRCRSILWPLFGGEHDWTEGYPAVPPDPGWGKAPAMMFGYAFRN